MYSYIMCVCTIVYCAVLEHQKPIPCSVINIPTIKVTFTGTISKAKLINEVVRRDKEQLDCQQVTMATKIIGYPPSRYTCTGLADTLEEGEAIPLLSLVHRIFLAL